MTELLDVQAFMRLLLMIVEEQQKSVAMNIYAPYKTIIEEKLLVHFAAA